MAYNVISRLSDSTIESNVELIRYLIERVKKQKTNEGFRDSILDYLSEKGKFTFLSSQGILRTSNLLWIII
jgi:hypothetical protein